MSGRAGEDTELRVRLGPCEANFARTNEARPFRPCGEPRCGACRRLSRPVAAQNPPARQPAAPWPLARPQLQLLPQCACSVGHVAGGGSWNQMPQVQKARGRPSVHHPQTHHHHHHHHEAAAARPCVPAEPLSGALAKRSRLSRTGAFPAFWGYRGMDSAGQQAEAWGLLCCPCDQTTKV